MPAATSVLDSVTHLTPGHRGLAVYCASHGGAYAGYYAAKSGIGAVIVNDAGIGRGQAGIAGLALLERVGVPAAAISHRSARIGDGADGFSRGVVSFVNGPAARRGVAVGDSCAAALERLGRAALEPAPTPPAMAESRLALVDAVCHGIGVVALDSAGLIGPDDAGHIVVTGSHGGLLGGRPETAAKYPVRAAVFNDAAFGIDDAGISRLPALDARGIAAACVSAFSARIGDARSTWADGIVSALNRSAVSCGGRIGQTTREWVAAVLRSAD